MKNVFPSLALSALILLAAACEKSPNPEIKKFAEADFDITLTETRQTHDFVYAYDKVSGTLSIDPKEQKLQELWVTKWNNVTLSAEGLEAGFEGVNASSSAPETIRISRKDPRTFSLEYLGDGQAVITVWSGEKYSYSFDVFAKEVIDLEYVEMGITDQDGFRTVKLKAQEYHDFESLNAYDEYGYTADSTFVTFCTEYLKFKDYRKPKRVDKYIEGFPGKSKYCDQEHDGVYFEIMGLHPENSSWRCATLKANISPRVSITEMNEKVGLGVYIKQMQQIDQLFPNPNYNEEADLDWSCVEGRKAYTVFLDSGTVRNDDGSLYMKPKYILEAIFNSSNEKRYVYCLPIDRQSCDNPPTVDNPVNVKFIEGGDDWFDGRITDYDY